MIVTPIKTNLIKKGDNLFEIISKNIKKLSEKSILAVTAKIISICQGRIFEKKIDNKSRPEKHKLIQKKLSFSQINIVDALAIAAVSEMGEAGEKQPFCLIEEVSNKVIFQNRPPNQKGLKGFLINIKNDPFFPVLRKTNCKKGKGGL